MGLGYRYDIYSQCYPRIFVSLDLGNLAACLCHNDPLNLNSDDLDARKPAKRCAVNATTLYYQGLQGGPTGYCASVSALVLPVKKSRYW